MFWLYKEERKEENVNSSLAHQVRKKLDNSNKGIPILVILVGESGVGKTTFARMMDCSENWFESSRAMAEALRQRGEPVNHDTIHSFANKAYGENPCWQVPKILDALDRKKFLILDGPRRIEEVRALLKIHPRTLVIRILTSRDETRFGRLGPRDRINLESFRRVVKDEAAETDLHQLLALADLTITNDGTIEDMGKTALELKKILQTIQ